MGRIVDMLGAEKTETEGPSGRVNVVRLSDDSRVIDRKSKSGLRTIETQGPDGKTRTVTRFPDEAEK